MRSGPLVLFAPVFIRPGGRIDVPRSLPGRIPAKQKTDADESGNDNDSPDEAHRGSSPLEFDAILPIDCRRRRGPRINFCSHSEIARIFYRPLAIVTCGGLALYVHDPSAMGIDVELDLVTVRVGRPDLIEPPAPYRLGDMA
jgi:hypothetical protein